MDKAAEESMKESGGIEDDDAEYYRQEVGEEPEHGILLTYFLHMYLHFLKLSHQFMFLCRLVHKKYKSQTAYEFK